MALYHLSAKILARADGRSVVAAASYRSGERLADERVGRVHDYRRRSGVVHSEILLPEGAPEWMADREFLWNAVEQSEKRRDAQLAREIELSLPRELSPDQRLDLIRAFVHNEFVSRGMVADLAVHCPTAMDGGEQPHAHVMLTLRSVSRDGFGGKDRSWNDKTLLSSWRERWGVAVNNALERAGHTDRVDHRSYRARGLDIAPQPKLGPAGHRARRAAIGGKPVPAKYRRRLERAAGHWMDGHAKAVGDKYAGPAWRQRPAMRLQTIEPPKDRIPLARAAEPVTAPPASPVAQEPTSAARIRRAMAGRPVVKATRLAQRGLFRLRALTEDLTKELMHDE